MFYGMTNVFSFLNVNTNKEKSINTLESFVVLFPEDSSRCFCRRARRSMHNTARRK